MSDAMDPAQMAEAIKGLSDEDLLAQVTQRGVDTTLAEIFAGMQEAFQPDKAGSTSAIIQYDIDTDEGTKSWTVNIADGACQTTQGAADNPRITLQVGLVNFVRLIFGQANGQQLFMTGKLKLKGDMMFAMQMQNYFKTPS